MSNRNRTPLSCIVILFLAAWLGSRYHEATSSAQPADAPKTIKLTVDYDDGVQKHFTRIKWKEGMTVLSATEEAGKHPRGIRYKYRGRGATAFLYKIDNLQNEAGGRGWLFRVNGKLADRSIGKFPLKAGDAVLWKFSTYQ